MDGVDGDASGQERGFGEGLRIITGLIKVGVGVLPLVPATSRFAILAVLGVSLGALVAQATRLLGHVIC